ncbi:helix-hairpin-helix domain-containing protein [Caproiciproducens sp.]
MTDLTKISGIGKNMAQHLIAAGYPNIDFLKGQSPDEVYAKDCFAHGVQIDRCTLSNGWEVYNEPIYRNRNFIGQYIKPIGNSNGQSGCSNSTIAFGVCILSTGSTFANNKPA